MHINPRGDASDPRYLGFFQRFNAQLYFEAHEVLEDLWLDRRTGPHQADGDFFKGLIQVAGAFVHLQKQFERPEHPKDGRRMHPAVRLFNRAIANLELFQPRHLRLDVTALCGFCKEWAETIAASGFQINPWRPDASPTLLPTSFSHRE